MGVPPYRATVLASDTKSSVRLVPISKKVLSMFSMPVSISLPRRPSLKFWKRNRRSASITDYDPTYKVLYLGNILTPYAKGEGCWEKPLQTLWKAYAANPGKVQTPMELTVAPSGIKAVTKSFGTTEYWAYRITYCGAPTPQYPGLFCWIYRHERPKMKQELRCHAALCLKPEHAVELTKHLKDRLALALQEFRREKLTRQKARLSLANAVYDCPSMPRRKLLLYRGSINFRPPIEMSKIAPKLGVIDEDEYEEEDILEIGTPEEDMYMSEASSLSSSPEEEEDLFSRFRMLMVPRRQHLNSNGEESSCSEEDFYCEETASNAEEDIPLIC